MTQATVLYPPANAFKTLVNVQDSFQVTYESTWAALNLTVLCRSATSEVYGFYNMPDNPILANGTYLTPSIADMDFGIRQYPGDCVFRLTEFGDINDHVDGGEFSLTSTQGVARTFGQSSTVGLATSTSSGSSSATTQTTMTTSTTASIVAVSSTAATGISGSVSPQQTSSSSNTPHSSSQSGLSKGAWTGIGVGVTLGVLLIIAAAAITWIFARRRKRGELHSPSNQVVYEKAELMGNTANLHPAYRPSSGKSSRLNVNVELAGSPRSPSPTGPIVPAYESSNRGKFEPRQVGRERMELP